LEKAKFKNWRKIQRILMNNFGTSGNNFTKLVHVVCRETGMKIWIQTFGGLHHQHFRAHKMARFWITLHFDR